MSNNFREYNQSDPELLAKNARKGVDKAKRNAAALQARIDAVVERAKAREAGGPGYDVLHDYRRDRGWRGSKLA